MVSLTYSHTDRESSCTTSGGLRLIQVCAACYLHLRRRPLPIQGCYLLGSDSVCARHFSERRYLTVCYSVWSFYVPLFGTLINLGLLYWKRHSHPWNFVLLSTFTLMEAFTLGVTVAFFDNIIVLQALCVQLCFCYSHVLTAFHSLITLGVFLGLTLFTFQSKV